MRKKKVRKFYFIVKREGCGGHEVALPLVAKYEHTKGLLERSETQNSPTRMRSMRGTPL